MAEPPLVVVGDVLLDRDVEGTVERLAPDAPVPVVADPVERSRPGGAGLAAALAAQGGRPVVVVTALGDDGAGQEVRALLRHGGVDVVDLGLAGATAEKVRIRGAGQPLVRVDRGGSGGAVGPVTAEAEEALSSAAAVLVSDYGRGMTASPGVRDALTRLPVRTPVVWDPHPLGGDPAADVRLATPNLAEARHFAGDVEGTGLAVATAVGRVLARRWSAAGVAVTLGSRGAVLVEGEEAPLAVPAAVAVGGDPCGAGDRFASSAATALAAGALPSEAVVAAVAAASAFVAAGGATRVCVGTKGPGTAGPAGAPSAADVAARVRRAGGTVVATGGCFDLLHAGHVALLHGARALGDCLVVCLNSDASVSRLKGPGRPVNAVGDRAAVLRALGSVDAVLVFDEDTPEAALRRLRPDVWVKGADYSVGGMPEAALVGSWGGQAVVLPYLEGRSTTRLLEEVDDRAAP
jgi:D-beta-D-heptose 7-phosphate kinase / D-beta-D-heptose 1-phosphate adenosyltransferase